MTDTVQRTLQTAPLSTGPAGFGTGVAVRRYWWIPLLLTILGAAVGYRVGSTEDLTYEAESRLTVADVDFLTRSVPGFVDAAQTLTSTYSRVVVDGEVVGPVAAKTGLSTAEVLRRVTSTPIPDSTIFTITAQGPDGASAKRLNRVTTNRLVEVVRGLDTTGDQAGEAYNRFRKASRESAALSDRVSQLKARRRLVPGSVKVNAILALQEKQAAAQLRVQVASARYQELTTSTPGREARQVSVLTRPRTATDNGDTLKQRYTLIGLVTGLAVGLALAAILGRRRWTRMLIASARGASA